MFLFYFLRFNIILVKKHGETGMLPLECPYLNKTALFTVVGQQVQENTLKIFLKNPP